MAHELVRLHNIIFFWNRFIKFAYSSKSTI